MQPRLVEIVRPAPRAHARADRYVAVLVPKAVTISWLRWGQWHRYPSCDGGRDRHRCRPRLVS